jgi:hypothetical protein
MAAKGFTKVADVGKPDLLLGYQLMIDQEKQINASETPGAGGEAGVAGAGGAEAASVPFRRILQPTTSALS